MLTTGQPMVASTSQPLVSPVHKNDRIVFLDCVRGLALLGILFINIISQSQPYQFHWSMNLNQPLTGPNCYVWVLSRGFFEGAMRGLFAILFGAGSYLLLSKPVKQQGGLSPKRIYFRRLWWLLVFGLFNTYVLLSQGDILASYALFGVLLFPFRNLPPKKLLIAALLLLALSFYGETVTVYSDIAAITKGQVAEKMEAAKQKLNARQAEELRNYQALKEEASSAVMIKKAKDQIRTVRSKHYLGMVGYHRSINKNIGYGLFFALADILVYFLVGFALLRSGYLEGKKSVKLYLAVAILGIGIGLTLNYFQLEAEYASRFDNIKMLQKFPFSYYGISRVCQTLGYLSLLIQLYKVVSFKKIIALFAPVGQMAFTNYLMQSFITSVIFFGMGWYGILQRYQVYYIVAGIWVFQIIFSHVWLRYYLFGPFEWLWRSLTYRKAQPMRKSTIANPELVPGVTMS